MTNIASLKGKAILRIENRVSIGKATPFSVLGSRSLQHAGPAFPQPASHSTLLCYTSYTPLKISIICLECTLGWAHLLLLSIGNCK